MTIDTLKVVLLRGHASILWARYPHMSQGAVEQSMREHADRMGASNADFEAARINLQAVRDDSPAPTQRSAINQHFGPDCEPPQNER